VLRLSPRADRALRPRARALVIALLAAGSMGLGLGGPGFVPGAGAQVDPATTSTTTTTTSTTTTTASTTTTTAVPDSTTTTTEATPTTLAPIIPLDSRVSG
jgi:hypothetical protein